MRKMMFLFAIAILVVAVNGCSKPPQMDIDAAKVALDGARSAEAGTYAEDSLRSAEDAMAQLDQELKVQEEKFALFRSYKKSTELATSAKAAGEKAQTDAKAGKEQKKGEAEAAISEAKTSLEATKAALDAAPKGKGTQADLAAMKADLEGGASVIAEAESAFNAEKYIDAKAKADGAKQTIQAVGSAIEQAKAAREAARAGRR